MIDKNRVEFEECLRTLVAYNPETGLMWWKAKPNRNIKIGTSIGHPNSWGHWSFTFKGKSLMVHRAAWFLVFGAWPEFQIDHVNGEKSDNRICNLRDVPQAINMQNQRIAHKGNVAGLLGVSFRRDRERNPWRANIKADGKNINLGSFPSPEEAHAAYLVAKLEVHAGHYQSLKEIDGK